MKINIIFLLILVPSLISCVSNTTSGDRMIGLSNKVKFLGNNWHEGDKLIADGKSMENKGEKLISKGKNLISKGEKLTSRGKAKVKKGMKLKNKSEKEFKNKYDQLGE